MTLLEYLDRAAERRRIDPGLRILPHDFRGWVALALFIQASSLFGLMWIDKGLMDNQGFMTLASAVVVTGWVGGVAAFAYSAGKQQGEASALAKQALDLAATTASPSDTPQPVTVENAADDPVPVEAKP